MAALLSSRLFEAFLRLAALTKKPAKPAFLVGCIRGRLLGEEVTLQLRRESS